MKERGLFYLHNRCGRTKDAADFAIVLTVSVPDKVTSIYMYLVEFGSIGVSTIIFISTRCGGHPLVKQVVTLSFNAKVDLADF